MTDVYLFTVLPLCCLVCRFIVHNDDNNPVLSSLEKFGSALKSFSPHLIIVSGLQMLDNFPFKPGVCLREVYPLRQPPTVSVQSK